MVEYIVKEVGYPGEITEEFVGELIRCKDCKYWLPHCQLGFDEANDVYDDYCQRLIPDDDYYAIPVKEDDFCSYAKRRKDG